MTMGAFDCTVFVGDVGIVAGWLHAEMRAERGIARGQIIDRGTIEIAEGGGKAGGAVLQPCATQGEQSILQPLGQGGIAPRRRQSHGRFSVVRSGAKMAAASRRIGLRYELGSVTDECFAVRLAFGESSAIVGQVSRRHNGLALFGRSPFLFRSVL